MILFLSPYKSLIRPEKKGKNEFNKKCNEVNQVKNSLGSSILNASPI
mgnify:CR=1 FL=1